jgi:type I restriction enzyme S subunit
MSRKTKTTSTKEEARPAFVPKLRFPEFRGADGWRFVPLDSVCDVLNNKRRPISSNERTPGPYPYYGASGIVDYVGDFLFDERLLLVGEDGAKWGAFESTAFIADGKYWVNNHAHVLKPFGASDTLLENYLTMQDLSPFVTGAAPPKLTLGKLKTIPVPLPPEPAEQQKIAECLSSVDELIAAQARKLESLKTHKKGLMQQLFPREGETQPRLRFPEFQNAGEWEVRTIGDMFDLINGCAFKPEDWKKTGTPIIRIQNLNDPSAEFNYSQESVPERNRVEPGDLLFAWSGTLGSSFGARIWNGPSGVLNQHIFKVLMDEKEIALHFALLVLAKVEDDIARRTHGFKASFVHVKKSDLIKVEMLLPTLPEQHRIATCLSSLDALIAAETQKHAALQRHKRGLMQQLFPSQEEQYTL